MTNTNLRGGEGGAVGKRSHHRRGSSGMKRCCNIRLPSRPACFESSGETCLTRSSRFISILSQMETRDLTDWGRGFLAGYQCPKHFVVRENLPLGHSGKIDKNALRTAAVALTRRCKE